MADFEGGGGGQEKHTGYKGGSPSSFTVTTSVMMQTANQNTKTRVSDVQKVQVPLRKHAPRTSYFIMHQKAILPQQNMTKNILNQTFD